MSPGMTTTPGIGGTTKVCPFSVGTFSAKPTTVRLGICVCSFSVSGMMVASVGSDAPGMAGIVEVDVPLSATVTEPRQHHRKIQVDGLIGDGERGREVVGLEVRLVEHDAVFAHLRGGERLRRDRATSSFSITSIVTWSGVARSSTSPPLIRRMFSSTCAPGSVSGGMLKGVLNRAVRAATGNSVHATWPRLPRRVRTAAGRQRRRLEERADDRRDVLRDGLIARLDLQTKPVERDVLAAEDPLGAGDCPAPVRRLPASITTSGTHAIA